MGNEDSQPKCPVDHSSRQTWLLSLLWKSNESAQSSQANTSTSTSTSQCPVPHQASHPAPTQDQPVCPVSPSSRQAWLDKVSVTVTAPDAIESPSYASHASRAPAPAAASASPPLPIANTSTDSTTCDSSVLMNDTSVKDNTTSNVDLPVEREISSIPRTSSLSNWIYPSQKQFFEAMQRKNWNPDTSDMKVIVPIHNLVNERAWKHILMWEQPYNEQATKECGGITLTSFKGDSKKMTPRAWLRLVIGGQQPPFDRHDWLVNRCGTEVEYVIDFYNGEEQGDANVWLDVRPKLNSWEGIKLRCMKAFGLS